MNNRQFISACSNGNIEKVKSLLLSGVPVDSTDRYGLTGLVNAARKGRLEVAKLLLEEGADVNFPDKRRRTPVFHAVCFDQREMVTLLARYGANLDVVDSHNCTPCEIAESERFFELVELLRTLGATSCSPKLQFLRMSVFLNNLHAKDRVSSFLADEMVKKITVKLNEIEVKTDVEQLDTVSVTLVVGLNLAVQPVGYCNRAVITDVGIPECTSEETMNVNVLNAIRNGYSAISEFLATNLAKKVDVRTFDRATSAVLDALASK